MHSPARRGGCADARWRIRQALAEPCVELAQWLLELLLEVAFEHAPPPALAESSSRHPRSAAACCASPPWPAAAVPALAQHAAAVRLLGAPARMAERWAAAMRVDSPSAAPRWRRLEPVPRSKQRSPCRENDCAPRSALDRAGEAAGEAIFLALCASSARACACARVDANGRR